MKERNSSSCQITNDGWNVVVGAAVAPAGYVSLFGRCSAATDKVTCHAIPGPGVSWWLILLSSLQFLIWCWGVHSQRKQELISSYVITVLCGRRGFKYSRNPSASPSYLLSIWIWCSSRHKVHSGLVNICGFYSQKLRPQYPGCPQGTSTLFVSDEILPPTFQKLK